MQILPIVISSDNAAIQQLPWETLCHPDSGFFTISPRYTWNRAIPNQQPLPEITSGPLRILLFTALPESTETDITKITTKDQARLNIEEEQAQVLAALLPLIRQGKVVLEMPDDSRYRAFCQNIKDFQPQLVFLSGHGIFHDEPIDDSPATAWFQFEDDLGRPDSQPAAKIADAFFGATVQCVVLSACESGKTSSEQINAGLVQHLAELGLPYVLGMRESVLDAAGHRFAHRLCGEIGNAATVVNALQSARQALAEPPKSSGKTALADLIELIKSQWSLPLLVAKHPHHSLIDWRFTPVPKQYKPLNQSINNISLPARFIGHRTELRTLNSQLNGQYQQLLITGPGGQGKTALAGKIAQNFEHQGIPIYAYSARANQKHLLNKP